MNIKKGENKNIEFKQEIPANHKKILKDIIAFANCSGGQIIIGVADDSGEVIGIGEQNPFKLSDSVSDMIFDACDPHIETDIYPGTLDEKTVLYVDVAPGKFRPYYLKSVGKEESTYIRINGISVPASMRKIQELELEGERLSYDKMREIGKDFDEKEANQLCKNMKFEALKYCQTEEEKRNVKDMTLQKLEDFGVLYKEGRNLYPTHAYSLLTNNKNKNAIIQCARFKGNNRKVFIDKREISGPIYSQVEEAYQFVLKHINIGVDIVGVHSIDKYELPLWSVREMIANAVVHRSYLVESCVQISIYDDRMEVDSPGMLYDGIDIEKAMSGVSRCRNSAIAEAFQYMRIIDKWGTGIPRILEECKEFGLPVPKFLESGDCMKFIMYRKLGSESEKLGSESEKLGSETEKLDIKKKPANNEWEVLEGELSEVGITKTYISSIKNVYEIVGTEKNFRQSDVVAWLQCSKNKAGIIIKYAKKARIIQSVKGYGYGYYEFRKL